MSCSQTLRRFAHQLLLVLRPLSVGIINFHAIDLWFLTSPEPPVAMSSQHDYESYSSKRGALRALKNSLCEVVPPSATKQTFTSTNHPLVDYRYRIVSFFGYPLVLITGFSAEFFDEEFYLRKYPGVTRHNEAPLSHYAVYGYFLLHQPSDGVFNSSPETDWEMREKPLGEKRNYLYAQSKKRKLLIPTDVALLNSEAAQLRTVADATSRDLTTSKRAQLPPETTDSVTVSIIIPCFQQSRFLAECLSSVALATTALHECIIIDDGNELPQDLDLLNSIQPAGSHQRVFVHSQRNTGIAGARNSGLRLAQGKYIKFLDSDDVLTPRSIDRQLDEIAKSDSDADVGGYQVVTDVMHVIAEEYGPISSLPLHANSTLNSTSLLASWEQGVALPIHSLLVVREKCPPAPQALRSKEDLWLWLELGISGVTFSTSAGVTALYRQHNEQMTSGSRARHGLYFLESLYDFDRAHPGVVDYTVLSAKISYIKDFYGSAPLKSWATDSPSRDSWLSNLV